MRVFLTGATGFIGSHTARHLIRKGCRVTAMVRPGANLQRVADIAEEMTLVEGDLADPGVLPQIVKAAAPELCLHLAWYLQPHEFPSSLSHLDCLTGSIALLRALPEAGCHRLVTAGTSIEYDTDAGYVTESSPARPRNLYSASKHALFLISEQLARHQGWSFAGARIFNVYGPWESEHRLVPHVICTLLRGEPCDLTSGEQIRDYLHAEDVASALVAVAMSDLEGPVNVASSQPIPVAALAAKIAALMGAPHLLRVGSRPPRPGDYPFLCANTELLRRCTKWEPRYSLEEGLRQTIAWWASRRE